MAAGAGFVGVLLAAVFAFQGWVSEVFQDADDGTAGRPAAVATASTDLPSLDTSERPTRASARRIMVRLDRGMVVRAEADKQAQGLHVLPDAALLEVHSRQGSWFQVQLPSGLAADRGWLYLVDGDSRLLRLESVWQVPRPSRSISGERSALARQHMRIGPQQGRCGSYPLLTDVQDAVLLAACDRQAASLDAAYERRYGVRPVAEGGETILLFRELETFRAFLRAEGSSTGAYAGHASALGGYLVMYVGEQSRQQVIETLVHELSHLVSWRALGGPLPRWLSEGLADGLGDTATISGIEPLQGVHGAEAEARRLLETLDAAELPSSEALVSLGAEDFDAKPTDRHYEHSALWVRFLLLDPQLAPRFHGFLQELATGTAYDSKRLRMHLALDWHELDRRFMAWLRSSRR